VAAPPPPPAASLSPSAPTPTLGIPISMLPIEARPPAPPVAAVPPLPSAAGPAVPPPAPVAGAPMPPPQPPASAAPAPPLHLPAGAVPPPAPPPAPPARERSLTPAIAPPAVPSQAGDLPLRTRKKRRAKQWYEEIFDDDYLRTLPYLTPRQTEREAQFVLDSLGLQPGANMLDLACGYGRHAMELAGKGYKVTGLDLSLPLLIRAADTARRAALNINFIHGDMREMTFDNEFDGAYSMFTSFGYFDDDTNRKVAANLARAIKPGGKLLLDVVNRDYLTRDLPTRVWWQGEGCVILEEVDFNYFSSRLQVQRSIIFEDGRQVEQEISIRAYSLHEIGKVLHHSGFRVTEVSGGLALRGKFFGAQSRQLLVLAEKKGQP
jgi:SAM-dependent methyltransferase